MSKKRVALIEAIQESNSFCALNCTLTDFQNSHYFYSQEILDHLGAASTEISGFIDVLRDMPDIEMVPIVATRACSGGEVDQATIDKIASDIREGLKNAGRLDGALLSLHGAMLGVSEADPEGYFLEITRKHLGKEAPIFASTDLHANITLKKIQMATGIVGYRHYPHDDSFDTGRRAARLLVRTLRGEIKPIMAFAKAPMLVPCNNSQTYAAPLGLVVDEGHRLESEGVLSVSLYPVQPWLDTPNMGFTSIVITDGDAEGAKANAVRLARMAWDHKSGFEVDTLSVDDAIREGLSSEEKTVLLNDTADAPGGGSTGDSGVVLKRMLALNVSQRCFVNIVDGVAAEEAAKAGIGAKVSLTVGNRLDTRRGDPVPLTGVVRHICDGRFLYKGLMAGTWGNMGLSVVVECGNISVLIASIPTYEWDDVQYRAAGMSVEDAKLVVIKNPINFKQTFRHITEKCIILDTPGPCGPNLTRFDYKRLTRPLYPFDEIGEPEITAVVGDAD